MIPLARCLGFVSAVTFMAHVGPLGCGPREYVQVEPTVAADEPPGSMPRPVSVAVEAPVKVPPEDAIDRLKRRFKEIGPSNLLVVRGQVTAAMTSERKLPQALYWGAEAMPVTEVTIAVSTTYCGPATTTVRASYVGGRLADGRVERTELMPSDLARGREYVFVLRSVANEYFLELGQEDLLEPNARGIYQDAARNPVPLTRLRGLCP